MPEPTKTESAPQASESVGKPEGEMYGNIVGQVIAKIRNEPFLFVIAVVSLLIGLTTLSTKLGSPDLRFMIVVIALLAFAVILGYYILAGLQTWPRKDPDALTSQRSPNSALHPSPSGLGSTDSIRERGSPERIVNAPNTAGLDTASPVPPSAPSNFSGKGSYSLNKLLAELYSTQSGSRRVVDNVGLNPAYIEFKDDALANWNNILSEARRRRKVEAIVEFACGEYPERASELKG
jgi:hypothetical protein